MRKIKEIVGAEIALVANEKAREALSSSYEDSSTVVDSIEAFFDEFSQVPWNESARRVFFNNWRSPGIGAASFCALTFRILEQAEKADGEVQRLLLRVAARVSDVSREDVGIGTVNHQTLYDQFASRLSGDDGWKLDRYRLPGAKPYLSESRRYRAQGEDLGVAITRSMAEELYNHGEFAYSAPKFVQWSRTQRSRGQDELRTDLHFIHDHLGTTESGHFAALVAGLEDYYKAHQATPDWDLLRESNSNLLNDMAVHYKHLMQRMTALQVADVVEVVA